MTDRLFIMLNCPECAQIKQQLKEEALLEDEFYGVHGQQLNVIHMFSNPGTRDTLDYFGIKDKFTPILQTYTGQVFEDVWEILEYLRREGFARV